MTFQTALGSKNTIDSVKVRVRLDNSQEGIGEIPTSFAFPLESLVAIRGIMPSVKAALKGASIQDYPDLVQQLRARFPDFRMTLSGIEVALFRAGLASEGKDEWTFWGGRQSTCRTDITVPFTQDRNQLERWLGRFSRLGFTDFKIKTSGEIAQDIRLIEWTETYLQAANRPFGIRIDANQGYQKDGFLRFMTQCQKKGCKIELVEQPLAKGDYRGHCEIRQETPVPIFLDESVQTLSDLRRVMGEGCCDGVNIKVAKSGIMESAQMIKEAREHGLRLMLGCMTETMTGLSAAINMAAGSGAFDYLDLDSIHLLFHRNCYEGIRIMGPEYRVLAPGQPRCS